MDTKKDSEFAVTRRIVWQELVDNNFEYIDEYVTFGMCYLKKYN